jgi:hypothetical protein
MKRLDKIYCIYYETQEVFRLGASTTHVKSLNRGDRVSDPYVQTLQRFSVSGTYSAELYCVSHL